MLCGPQPRQTGQKMKTVSQVKRAKRGKPVKASRDSSCADARPLILIIDDEPCSRDLRRFFFEEMGYRVVEAEDGQEGVEAAIRERPRLILMNYLMPKMNGLIATKMFRRRKALKHIPILMNSACAAEDMRDKALSAGCNDYLEEPCFHDELLEKVAAYILVG
jgi:CheY-like chemotaxis protein